MSEKVAKNVTKPARWWIATIPYASFTPYLPSGITYISGQLEDTGDSSSSADSTGPQACGYKHWQCVLHCRVPSRLSALRKLLGPHHFEPTRSSAAVLYCRKSATQVSGTQFELGEKPIDRKQPKDWDKIWDSAKSNRFDEIPRDVLVRCYSQLSRISRDHMRPDPIEKEVFLFWGPTGTGKSRKAWEEATFDAYPKDPRTKFWDGYRQQENVVIDEFRGSIDIAHLLRWFDRYPVAVETKGSGTVLSAKRIWITSNLPPECWYPGLDEATLAALNRRLKIKHFVM